MIRVLSLLCLCCTFVVGSSSISRRGEEGRSQIATALADQAFRDVSARVSAGIMISRRAVRGRYRYAGTAFVTAQQLRSMLAVDYIHTTRGRSGVSRVSKSQCSWRALEGGGAATDWGWFIRV
jgi:hypothetical protein